MYFHGISVLSNDILFFLSNELNKSRIFSRRLYKYMVYFLLSYYFLSPTCYIYFFSSANFIQHKTSCSQQFFICLLRLTSSVQLKCWMGYHARVVDPGKYYPDPAPSLEKNPDSDTTPKKKLLKITIISIILLLSIINLLFMVKEILK